MFIISDYKCYESFVIDQTVIQLLFDYVILINIGLTISTDYQFLRIHPEDNYVGI